jgi:ribosomal-protein-alanine N-acetyltransferase
MLSLTEHLNQKQLFLTERVSLMRWQNLASELNFEAIGVTTALTILSPKVTKDLPDGWQAINSPEKASKWIAERELDSNFYAILLNDTKQIIGFLFLYREDKSADLRLGYLIGEAQWRKGLGTELIKGLVAWCQNSKVVKSLSGGVEVENIASIKVLVKCGFHRATDEMPLGVFLYRISF